MTSKHYEQVLGRSHARAEDGRGAEMSEPGGENGPHLSSDDEEHLGVGDHYDERRQEEVDEREHGPENAVSVSDGRTHRDPTETHLHHSRVSRTADHQIDRAVANSHRPT